MRALWPDRRNCSHNVSQKVKRIRRLSDNGYAAPIGAFFCPEIRAFTGRDFFYVSKVLSDTKVLFKHKNGR